MYRTRIALITGLTVGLFASVAAGENWTPVASTGSSLLVEEDTRLNQLDPIFAQLFLPDQDEDLKLTSIARLFPIDPKLLGVKKVKKARAKVTASCLSPGGNRSLGSKTVKANENGGLVYTREVGAELNCDFFQLQWDFFKKTLIPGGTSVQLDTAVELIGPNADADCFDADSSCLNDDRFKVEVDWKPFTGAGGGSAIGFPRTDDSGLFYFLDPDNWELLVKVLDGCSSNGHFWVFAAATTNVEYELRVVDTVSGQTGTYGNQLGQPAPPVLDTSAFATCP